jgi:hypothetical protein
MFIFVSWVISSYHFVECGGDTIHQPVPTGVNEGEVEVTWGWKMELQENMEIFQLPD